MNFDLSEEQNLLAASLGRYFTERYPFAERMRIAESDRGFSQRHWHALANLGIVGVLLSEKQGGFGGNAFDIAVVFERLGAALAVEPLLAVAMTAAALGDALPDTIVGGSAIPAFAHQEAALRHDPETITTRAVSDGEAWRLSGHKGTVRQIEAACNVVVTARHPGGTGIYLVDPASAGVSVRGYPMADGGRAGELIMNEAPARLVVSGQAADSAIERALSVGILALCWEAIGIMDQLRDATRDYMRVRRQFGAAIGSFQALRHRMSTVAIEIEQARSAAINAAAGFDAAAPGYVSALSAAKYTIGRVGELVAEEAIQLHGGIAMTWELPVAHYAKRLIQIGHELGDQDYHLGKFVSLEFAK